MHSSKQPLLEEPPWAYPHQLPFHLRSPIQDLDAHNAPRSEEEWANVQQEEHTTLTCLHRSTIAQLYADEVAVAEGVDAKGKQTADMLVDLVNTRMALKRRAPDVQLGLPRDFVRI